MQTREISAKLRPEGRRRRESFTTTPLAMSHTRPKRKLLPCDIFITSFLSHAQNRLRFNFSRRFELDGVFNVRSQVGDTVTCHVE